MNDFQYTNNQEQLKDRDAFSTIDELKNYVSFLDNNVNRNMVFFANSVSNLEFILKDNTAELRRSHFNQFLENIKKYLFEYSAKKSKNSGINSDDQDLWFGKVMSNALYDVMNILVVPAGVEPISKKTAKPRYSNEQISNMINILNVTKHGLYDLIRRQEEILYELTVTIKDFTSREVEYREIEKLIKRIKAYIAKLKEKECEINERQIELIQKADNDSDESEDAPEKHI